MQQNDPASSHTRIYFFTNFTLDVLIKSVLRNQRQEKSEFPETEKKDKEQKRLIKGQGKKKTFLPNHPQKEKFYQTPTNATKEQIFGLPKKN